jgi:hypothetical protein
VPSVPIYVQDRVHPKAIIEDMRRQCAMEPGQAPGGCADVGRRVGYPSAIVDVGFTRGLAWSSWSAEFLR